MAATRESPVFVQSQPLSAATSADRAGPYAMDELQRLLEPVLAPVARETPWPPGYALSAAAAVSLALWSLVAFAVTQFF